MGTWGIVLAICWPLFVAGLIMWRRAPGLFLAPWAGIPALALAIYPGYSPWLNLPDVLLDTRLGLDETGRIFLLFTALLWMLAGIYARAYLASDGALHRFFGFFLLAMSGNFGLILSHDMASFYTFFALMSFASYGLIVHDGKPESQWAGRVYLILVVTGEVLLVSGLFMALQAADTVHFAGLPETVSNAPMRDEIMVLVFLGFGIKTGVVPLHVWLPLAHPVAPTPASAVLSGAMIKAGLIGWMRFLPLGTQPFVEWGAVCIALGIFSAFYGVAVGLFQRNPKTVLAYSSISQMGFVTVGLGVGLMEPVLWPVMVSAVGIYALHHALAKGALFLGVGVVKDVCATGMVRMALLGGLLLPALALSGAPLTSGAAAKMVLKDGLSQVPVPWMPLLLSLLILAAVGTTVLMGRFLWLMWPSGKKPLPPPGVWMPWAVLLICVVITTRFFVDMSFFQTLSWSALWPALLGIGLIAGVIRLGYPLPFDLPAGDIVIVIQKALVSLSRLNFLNGRRIAIGPWIMARATGLAMHVLQGIGKTETELMRWQQLGLSALCVIAILMGLALW